MIIAMNNRLRRGGEVCPEQVFGVLVVSNPALKEQIRKEFGKGYAGMNRKEQREVIDKLGLTDAMNELQHKLQSRQMRTGSLADLADRYNDLNNPAPTTKDSKPEQPTPTRSSFVERLGLSPTDTTRSHTERVIASQAAAPELAALSR
jgi:hypothetical protein